MDLNGKAIKVNNIEDVKKVIAFFKDKGYDTSVVDDLVGMGFYRKYPYFCVCGGSINIHSIEYIINNIIEVIELPIDTDECLSEYKEKLMYVSNYPITEENMKYSLKRLVFMKHDGLYYTWSDSTILNNFVHHRPMTWKYAMDVPTEDNNKQELIKKVDELIKLSDELIKEGNQLKAKAVAMKEAANKL